MFVVCLFAVASENNPALLARMASKQTCAPLTALFVIWTVSHNDIPTIRTASASIINSPSVPQRDLTCTCAVSDKQKVRETYCNSKVLSYCWFSNFQCPN